MLKGVENLQEHGAGDALVRAEGGDEFVPARSSRQRSLDTSMTVVDCTYQGVPSRSTHHPLLLLTSSQMQEFSQLGLLQ